MCGIFLAIPLGGRRLPPDAEARVSRALHAIRHRGPDAAGIHVDEGGRFALGHVRLAVIDPRADSNQPMWSSCGRRFVVFNGEIYNFVELRADLEREGVAFRTGSDTEVLLHAISRWGPGCIDRFNGMWSFAWGDLDTGEIIVSRDRWGVKPLYTWVHEGTLLACSEAKGLHAYAGSVPPADHGAIGLFVRFGFGGELRQSWFRGIERFPACHWQRFDLGRGEALPPTRYWDYPPPEARRVDAHAGEAFEALFQDAVRIRLRSDVPLGLSLSGGVDSASIAWMVGENCETGLQAFTAWYRPEERSELPRAREVAARFGHTIHPVEESAPDRILADLRDCIWHLDSGHSSWAIVPYLNLCRAARTRLTVMLEGQGADELLAGYVQFQLFAGIDALVRGRLWRAWDCLSAYASVEGWHSLAADLLRFSSPAVYRRQADLWGASALLGRQALEAEPADLRRLRLGASNLDSALRQWHRNNLANLLQYGDAISMSVNLEARCPFLDYRLVELGFSLCPDQLVGDGFGKRILRSVASERLPASVCWQRRKEGFTNPTAREVTQIVRTQGLPARGARWAVDAGLFAPAVLDRDRLQGLPENAAYRLASVCLWAEQFQCGESRA